MQRIRHRLEPAVPGILVVGLLALWIGAPIHAQTRLMNVGDFRLRIEASDYINTNEVDPTGEWPQDYFRYANIVFYNSATAIGQWVDSTGTLHEKEVNFYPVSYDKTEPYGIKE